MFLRSEAGKRISEGLVEAAIDPSRWDTAMDVVAEATDSFAAAMFPVRGTLPGVSRNGLLSSIPKSREMIPSFDSYLRDGWSECDERFRSIPTIIQKGVATDLDFVSC